MESLLCVDIPIQMISCTDTNGTITPLRFRFQDRNGELVTVTIDRVTSTDQHVNKMGIHYSCEATIWGRKKSFQLRYSYYAHEWKLYSLSV